MGDGILGVGMDMIFIGFCLVIWKELVDLIRIGYVMGMVFFFVFIVIYVILVGIEESVFIDYW